MGYEYGPSENSLTINTTHRMPSFFEDTGPFEHLAAYAPTRRWEKLKGYDVNLPMQKAAVYQYKRPRIREKDTVPDDELDRQFKLSREQWMTLLLLFEPGEAFFTLPVVWDDEEMPEAADRTVFLDVYGVLPDSTLTYIPPERCTDGQISGFLTGKTSDGKKYLLHPQYTHSWERHRDELNDCTLGLRLWDLDEEREYVDVVQEEKPRPDEFREFQERLDILSGNGYSAEERREWAHCRLASILLNMEREYRLFYRCVLYCQNGRGMFRIPSLRWFMRTNDYARKGIVDWDDRVVSEFDSFDIPEDVPFPESRSEVQSYIFRLVYIKETYEILESVLDTFEEADTDPTTYRLKGSRYEVFGR